MKILWLFGTVLLIGTLAGGCAIMPSYTPNIKGKEAVSSLERIELGGVKQSVLIRGQDREDPILLFLHGGPGMPAMFLSHAFQREWEEEFVVVQWDRRGAGKSYRKRIDPATITDEQYFADALELIDNLRDRFHTEKIVLLGHSWGTYLGSLLAHNRPDLFHAYISVGQVVDANQTHVLQEKFIREKAGEYNRPQAIADLEQYGTGAHEKWLFKFGAEIHADTSYRVFVREGLRSPEYSLCDALKIPKGSRFCSEHIEYRLIDSTIGQEITHFDLPVFYMAGRHDMTTPTPLIEEYYHSLDAPDKDFFLFEDSAHFPFYEEPGPFFETLCRIKARVMSE